MACTHSHTCLLTSVVLLPEKNDCIHTNLCAKLCTYPVSPLCILRKLIYTTVHLHINFYILHSKKIRQGAKFGGLAVCAYNCQINVSYTHTRDTVMIIIWYCAAKFTIHQFSLAIQYPLCVCCAGLTCL